MKTLSQWASRHAPLAIALIILFDVTNALNGFVLGATLLDNVPTAGLLAGVTVLVGWAVAVRWLYYTSAGGYWFRRRCLFGAFLGNFLLFGLVAGLMTPRPQPHDVLASAWGRRIIESRADTLIRPDTLRPVRQLIIAANTDQTERQTGKRVGFVLLFVLSLVLLYGSVALACSIACSGYGFLATVVYLLGLGFLAGGIFFLGRLRENQSGNFGR